MIGYVRRLPGPVWTMLLWCTLYAINRTSGGFHSAGQLRDWLPEVAFELTIIAVLLAWGAKAPMWFLKAVVFAQLAVSFAILLLADDPVRELAVATGSILAVLYAGIWLRGRLTYIVAAAASASYLVAIIWGGMLEIARRHVVRSDSDPVRRLLHPQYRRRSGLPRREPRRTHRTSQPHRPGLVHRAPSATGPFDSAPVPGRHRPRWIQGHQRHAGTRGRRPSPASHHGRVGDGLAIGRHSGADRRG